MKKYDVCDLDEESLHYNYCKDKNIPFIAVRKKVKDIYRYIDYDLITIKNCNKITDNLFSEFSSIYMSYVNFFCIPDSVFSLSGGDINAGFIVLDEHALFIADKLYDYLTSILNKYT